MRKVVLVSLDAFFTADTGRISPDGFLAGMLAGNYDIKEIFVDGILKIGGADYDELGNMFAKLDKLTGKDTLVTFTVSADVADLPESVTKYL